MQVKTAEGKIKDVAIANVTPENYIVPNDEKDTYHCLIEIEQWNRGTKISTPRIQKFGKRYFENGGFDEIKRQGYTVVVLYNPNKTPKQIAAEEIAKAKAKEDEENARVEAAKKADAEKFVGMREAGIIEGTKADAEKLVAVGVIHYLPDESLFKTDESKKDDKPKKK